MDRQVDIQLKSYKTSHKNRGIALIFAMHEYRKGSKTDLERLNRVLKHLKFEVKIYSDRKAAEVRQVLEDVSKLDHTNNDCLLIVSMTHGSKEKIRFKDRDISIDELWANFVGNNCPSLIGKPKLVFVQACRGDKHDTGVSFLEIDATVREVKPLEISLPTYADLLVMYSSYQDYFSYRDPLKGSAFIQALCEVLESNVENTDLLRLLNHVTYLVANDSFLTEKGIKKQQPTISSTLSKTFYLVKK